MDRRAVRRRLHEERERLRQILAESEETLRASADAGDPGPTELSAVDQHPADIGSELFERQKELSIRESSEVRLQEMEDALRKLDDGTYGICEVCGNPIGKERLQAVPTARSCLDDQRRAEREAAAGG